MGIALIVGGVVSGVLLGALLGHFKPPWATRPTFAIPASLVLVGVIVAGVLAETRSANGGGETTTPLGTATTTATTLPATGLVSLSRGLWGFSFDAPRTWVRIDPDEEGVEDGFTLEDPEDPRVEIIGYGGFPRDEPETFQQGVDRERRSLREDGSILEADTYDGLFEPRGQGRNTYFMPTKGWRFQYQSREARAHTLVRVLERFDAGDGRDVVLQLRAPVAKWPHYKPLFEQVAATLVVWNDCLHCSHWSVGLSATTTTP